MVDSDKHRTDDIRSRVDHLVQLIWNDQRIRIQAGDLVMAEDYLKQFSEVADNIEASVDVVYNEFLVRAERNGLVDENEFYDRFPELATRLKRQIRLAHAIQSGLDGDRPENNRDSGTLGVANALTVSSSIRSPGDIEGAEPARRINSYELGPEIGRGSFAIVYQAWDPRLKRNLAIKMPRAALLESSGVKKRMLREARSAAQLYHPSIVPVHEIGEHEGSPYIVMDFVDGVDMETELARGKPAISNVLKWMISLADALHYAHQNGIIHRDIKPANVLIRKDGQVLLTDFGLAQLADSAGSITSHGDILGTPSYMSPEQASGKLDIDFRTDIYSLGVVLFQCLSGELPFDGPMSSILHRVIHEPIESVRAPSGSLPRDLATITLKCLNKDPSDRYQTARDLADDLKRFLTGEPVHARPVGILEKMVKQARRRPRTAALVVITLMLLGFVGGGAFQLDNVTQQRDRAQNAERQAQSLVANATFDAGLLAKRRGRLTTAIDRFRQSTQRGYSDPVAAWLQLAECQIASGNVGDAKLNLRQATSQNVNPKHAAKIAYWNCELALLDPSCGNPLELMKTVPLEDLTQDQRDFLSGMQARHSLKAVELFRSALDHNPYHHSARRSWLIMALSLARFDDVLREARISQQLYPEDDDFVLLEALALAGTDQSGEATTLVNRTRLAESEKSAWTGFCSRINYITSELTNEDASGQFNVDVIMSLGSEFRERYLPLVRDRCWHFPPRIAALFLDLPTISPGAADQQVEKVFVSVNALANSHPEASLLTLAGRTCIDEQRREIKDLEQARDLFQASLNYPAFVHDAHHHARIGVFATSVQLALLKKHEVEKNTISFVDALSSIDPYVIRKPNRLRTITLSLMQAKNWEMAGAWSKRWSELANQTQQQRMDALWHYGISLEQRGRWLELVGICDELLKLDPERIDVVRFRDTAIRKLRSIRSSNELSVDSNKPGETAKTESGNGD